MPTDRRAAAALEFALVSVPFVGLLLGLAVVALNLYLQAMLDLSLQTAVRQVQLGQVPSTFSAGDFAAKVFCPVFVAFAACDGIVLTLVPVADFLDAAVVATPAASRLGVSAGFCAGLPGQLMFARAVYLAPLVSDFWPYATTVALGGTTVTALVATAAFANENPSGAAISMAGGC